MQLAIAAAHRACGTVTLMESDGLVWAEEAGDALYVHKLAVARRDARLRLDTWDGNRKMRDYYECQGFRHVRDQYFAPHSDLPADYRGTHKSLYQLEL